MLKMEKVIKYILPAILLIVLSSCGTAKLKRLQNCSYSYSGISNVTLSGKPLDAFSKDNKLGTMGASIFTKLMFAKEAPMSFNVLVKVTNNGKKVAALDKMEWTALYDDKELLSGLYNEHFEVQPGKTETMTIPVNFDLKEKMSGSSGAAFKNFGMAYLLSGTVKKLSIKVKPYVGGVKLPTSIEIKPFENK